MITYRSRAVLLVLTATILSAGLITSPAHAGCGCDKPPPAPAPVRPSATYSGLPVTIFSSQLLVGKSYKVTFTSGISGANATVTGTAVSLRDQADGEYKPQLVITVPPLPLGPTKIAVRKADRGTTTVLFSFGDSALTVAPPPIAVPQKVGDWQFPDYQAAVGRDGTLYMSLDLSGLTEPLVFDAWSVGYALRYDSAGTTFYNTQGFLMQALVAGTTRTPVPGMFVFPATTAADSDVLHYSRHEFATYFLQHFERGVHEVDETDPNWHVDGTPHIDHNHLIVAINGKLATGSAPAPGATPKHLLRVRSESLFSKGVVGVSSVTMKDLSGIDSFSPTTGQFSAAGRVYSNGPVDVKDYAMAFGDVTGAPVTVATTALVSGTITANTQPVSFMAIKVPSGLPSLGNIVLGQGQSQSLVGPGSFVVGNITLSSNGSLVVDNTAGPVTLYVTGTVSVTGNARITVTDQNPERFAIYVSGGGAVNMSGFFSTAYAVVYAPDSAVTVGLNTELYGAVVGKTVLSSGSSEVHFHDGLLGVQPVTYAVKSLIDTTISNKISAGMQSLFKTATAK